MVLANFKVFYSTLWYGLCVLFLMICFECEKNCHLIWGTKRCNIIFIYCIRLRNIDVMCLPLRWRHWCVNCKYANVLQVLKPAKSQQHVCIFVIIETPLIWDISKFSFKPWTSKLRQQLRVFFSPNWTSYIKEAEVACFRYETFVFAGSGAKCTKTVRG